MIENTNVSTALVESDSEAISTVLKTAHIDPERDENASSTFLQ